MESVRESICKSCANKRICSSAILEARNIYMTGCSRFEEAKPQTNADRIRSMTNEELAHLLHSAEEHLFTGNLWNYEKWTDWLKGEVDK